MFMTFAGQLLGGLHADTFSLHSPCSHGPCILQPSSGGADGNTFRTDVYIRVKFRKEAHRRLEGYAAGIGQY